MGGSVSNTYKLPFFPPLQAPLDPLDCFFGAFSCAEGGDADVAFAGGTEAGAGGYYYLGAVEEMVEKFPRVVLGGFDPNVGGVFSAKDR